MAIVRTIAIGSDKIDSNFKTVFIPSLIFRGSTNEITAALLDPHIIDPRIKACINSKLKKTIPTRVTPPIDKNIPKKTSKIPLEILLII